MKGRRLACRQCNTTLEPDSRRSRCGCGGLLELAGQATSDPASVHLLERFAGRRAAPVGIAASGVWRYRELVLPEATDSEIVSFPEGDTPLLHRETISHWTGLGELLLKHEGLNPTGSFKDRGMTVGVTHARRLGVAGVICASTGNTAASMAAYAAQAQLRAVVLVPAGRIALGKMAQTVAHGARILAVDGDFDACINLVEDDAEQLGLYVLNSINPFRLEGQKTIVFELLEQLGWDPPDWIVLPAGNLGNTAAFGSALSEARAAGFIDRMPRLAAVQANGANPFARSYASGFGERFAVQAETVATAIRIGNPVSHDRAVEAIKLTDGVVASVSDDDILEAKRRIDAAGVGCEPASAAAVAGVRQLVQEGTIGKGERVVAVLTGHLLKDPEVLLTNPDRPPVIEVAANLEAVRRAALQPG